LGNFRGIFRSLLKWGAVICVVMVVSYAFSPPNTFNPFCTYDLTYRLRATLEAEGKQYSSEAIHQKSRPRRWIMSLNGGGCPSSEGTTLAFRLDDNRLVLIGSTICREAEHILAYGKANVHYEYPARAMRDGRKVDVSSLCTGVVRSRDRSTQTFLRYDGYLIDNADKPTRWTGFRFYDNTASSPPHFRMVSAVAEAADISPTDDLDRVAPEMIKTDFKGEQGPLEILPQTQLYTRKFTHVADQY
jgi:hypothetical protein